MLASHPDIAVEMRDATRLPAGERRLACVNNPVYRHFSGQIAAQMAARYGQNPAVIGWQIDNELIGPEYWNLFECHCPSCRFLFREWLKKRYASLDELNRAWFLDFWSGSFGDWGEVGTPRCHRAVKGHVIDFFRFYSDSQVEYIKLQYAVLKGAVSKTQFVSHNSTGIFDRGINHRDYARALDVTGWDAYCGAASAGHCMEHPFTAAGHDLFRSALMKPFWVFETNTDDVLTAAQIAAMRAHGAKGVIFWHWRRHRGNVEQTGAALANYAGKPNKKRLAIIRDAAERLRCLPDLPAQFVKRPAAIFNCPDNVRAVHREAKRPIPRNDAFHLDAFARGYFPAWRHGVGMDVLQPGDDPAGYKLAVLPGLHCLDAKHADALANFVRNGGTLLFIAKTAHCDTHAVFYPTPGGPLAELFGFHFEDDEPNRPPCVVRMNGGADVYPVENPYEVVVNSSAEVLGVFEGGEADGRPAVLRNTFGAGQIFYIAARNNGLICEIMKTAFTAAGIAWHENPYEDVAVIPDLSDASKIWLVNHGNEPRNLLGCEVGARGFAVASFT